MNYKRLVVKALIYFSLALPARYLIGWLGPETAVYFLVCAFIMRFIDWLFEKPKKSSRLVLNSDGTWHITAPCKTDGAEV